MLIASWIAIAYSLGLLARPLGLPPLVGYLLAGFLLHAAPVRPLPGTRGPGTPDSRALPR